ncbi:MAG: LEA type 2 family protein, partial [Vicinamibacterales bacterium]
MTRRSSRLVVLVVLLASFATACASLDAPRIQVQRLGRPQMGLTGATLDVTFSVRNPNPDPITIERVRYDLYLNGLRVGDGFITQTVELAGFGEARMSSRFDLNYLRLPGAVKSIMDRDRVEARTRG